MGEPGMYSWNNPWFRWSVSSVCVLGLLSVLVGFVWLPSVHGDFTAQGIWDSICRAAGVPGQWGDGTSSSKAAGPRSTNVVLTQSMVSSGSRDTIGRGAAIVAKRCDVCHEARGVSEARPPVLAGQYSEVVIKQLYDYKRGARFNSIMHSFALTLSDEDIESIAAYYDSLPTARAAPVRADETNAPALVRVGDPLRNIAPCISCHGGIDHKLGTPWLEGMPKTYLSEQLKAFASGTRRNDSHGQMRNVARHMTSEEIEQVADFYVRRGREVQNR